jgi:hypothetical protein
VRNCLTLLGIQSFEEIHAKPRLTDDSSTPAQPHSDTRHLKPDTWHLKPDPCHLACPPDPL